MGLFPKLILEEFGPVKRAAFILGRVRSVPSNIGKPQRNEGSFHSVRQRHYARWQQIEQFNHC